MMGLLFKAIVKLMNLAILIFSLLPGSNGDLIYTLLIVWFEVRMSFTLWFYNFVCFVTWSCHGLPLTLIFITRKSPHLHKKHSSELPILVKHILGKCLLYFEFFSLIFLLGT